MIYCSLPAYAAAAGDNTFGDNDAVRVDLSPGNITISKPSSTVISIKQNGEQVSTPSRHDAIAITQSSPEPTRNHITVDGSVDCAQKFNLENLNINCKNPIVVEKKADVNFILHNNNTLTATNC